MDAQSPVGVFDSGIGGLSILKSLRSERPTERFVYFADTAFAPYGERGEAHVVARSLAIARVLREQHHIKALVVACNTATAAAIAAVRSAHPDLPIVGVEPALKPALALTRTGHIGVLATRGTVQSAKFLDLLHSLSDQARFSVTACDGLAHAIEAQDTQAIKTLIAKYTQATASIAPEKGSIDTWVLGCTHYPLEEAEFRAVLGTRATLVEPGAAVARQLSRLLGPEEAMPTGAKHRLVTWLTSASENTALMQAVDRWLPQDRP